MPSLAARSREVVSQGIAEQLEPIIRLHEAIRREARVMLDLERVAARVASDVPAFDPLNVIRAAGDLDPEFWRAVRAFERAGIATTTSASEMRQRHWDVVEVALGWLVGERAPADPAAALALRSAALVANAVLGNAAEQVALVASFEEWERAICPCCGGSPDLALVHGSARTLVCSRCDTSWQRWAAGCLGCGADRAPTMGRVRSAYLGYTLAICHACGRYLKERAGRDCASPLVERALTEELDAAAELRGLRI